MARILIFIGCVLNIVLCSYGITTTLHDKDVYLGDEEFSTREEASAFQEKLYAEMAMMGTVVEYVKIDGQNTVSYSIYAPDIDDLPYGERLVIWYSWVCFYCGGIFLMLFLLGRFFLPRRNKKLKTPQTFVSSKYTPEIVKHISLPKDTSGIIAVREWRVKADGCLFSTAWNCIWTDKVQIADKPPRKDNSNGIYAYRLGMHEIGSVIGLVSLSGRCMVGQQEGVIRAERCDILLLLAESHIEAIRVSARYGVSACVDAHYNQFDQWLISDEGITGYNTTTI